MSQLTTAPRPRSPGSAPHARFVFHGLALVIASESAALLDEVRRDFYYFRDDAGVAAPTEFHIECNAIAPRYEELPSLTAAFITPRNVCYRSGDTTYIDYFGRALARFERRARRCVVYSSNADLLYEIAYLCVLSIVGQHLDGIGLHRAHALGVSHRGAGVLVLLPSGGGKSTLALELLQQPDVRLLAEDTPLIDRQGRVVPFPLRLGARPNEKSGIPERHVRTIRRMEFDPKTLIDIEYFAARLEDHPVPAKVLLVGERNLGERSAILPTSRTQAFKALTKYMIIGLGVYQGLEFLLERGVGDLLGKGSLVTSRLRNAFQLVRKASAHRFVIGRDPTRNSRTLLDFLNGARRVE